MRLRRVLAHRKARKYLHLPAAGESGLLRSPSKELRTRARRNLTNAVNPVLLGPCMIVTIVVGIRQSILVAILDRLLSTHHGRRAETSPKHPVPGLANSTAHSLPNPNLTRQSEAKYRAPGSPIAQSKLITARQQNRSTRSLLQVAQQFAMFNSSRRRPGGQPGLIRAGEASRRRRRSQMNGLLGVTINARITGNTTATTGLRRRRKGSLANRQS
jgi:hypothetical protein